MKILVASVGLAALVAAAGCKEKPEPQPASAGAAYEGYSQTYGGGYSQKPSPQPNPSTLNPPRNYQGYTNANPYPFH